jgi:uncharacterized membrane protein
MKRENIDHLLCHYMQVIILLMYTYLEEKNTIGVHADIVGIILSVMDNVNLLLLEIDQYHLTLAKVDIINFAIVK